MNPLQFIYLNLGRLYIGLFSLNVRLSSVLDQCHGLEGCGKIFLLIDYIKRIECIKNNSRNENKRELIR